MLRLILRRWILVLPVQKQRVNMYEPVHKICTEYTVNLYRKNFIGSSFIGAKTVKIDGFNEIKRSNVGKGKYYFYFLFCFSKRSHF